MGNRARDRRRVQSIASLLALAIAPIAATIAPTAARADDWTSGPLWTTATLSQGRFNLTATTVGTKAFFAGGRTTGTTASNVVDVYDSVTNSWSTLTLSQSRYWLAATSVGTKALFGGGYTGSTQSNIVDIYDTATSTWSTKVLPFALDSRAAVSAGGKAFFAGGENVANGKQVDIYDLATDSWSSSNLSQARYNLGAAALGNKVYFAGGSSPADSNVVDIYDTMTSTWTTRTLGAAKTEVAGGGAGTEIVFAGAFSTSADVFEAATGVRAGGTTMSAQHQFLVSAVAGNQIFIAGGFSGSTPTSVVDIFDASSGTWQAKTLSVARGSFAATTVGNKVMFAGGDTGSASNVVDIYNAQLYPNVTSNHPFTLLDHTIVSGRMDLQAGASLTGSTFSLTVGSLTGAAPISMTKPLIIGGDNTDSVYTGQITGTATASLTKIGTGTITLAANHSIQGGIVVEGGKLVINGAITSTPITVQHGGAVQLIGSSNRGVTVFGPSAAAPTMLDQRDGLASTYVLSGASGKLTVGGAFPPFAADLEFELGATADKIQLDSTFSVNGGGAIINITELPGASPGIYDLITFASATGSLDNVTLGNTTLPSGLNLALQRTATAEQLVVTPAPEPTMLGLAAIGFLAAQRRRRR